mmetsp:Transcript_25814/g.29971  ORF Transcript_25814/g.29971 Transcript_25814/m.29971 type:complete len:93 (+) Transcript_25814:689-967(+)
MRRKSRSRYSNTKDSPQRDACPIQVQIAISLVTTLILISSVLVPAKKKISKYTLCCRPKDCIRINKLNMMIHDSTEVDLNGNNYSLYRPICL